VPPEEIANLAYTAYLLKLARSVAFKTCADISTYLNHSIWIAVDISKEHDISFRVSVVIDGLPTLHDIKLNYDLITLCPEHMENYLFKQIARIISLYNKNKAVKDVVPYLYSLTRECELSDLTTSYVIELSPSSDFDSNVYALGVTATSLEGTKRLTVPLPSKVNYKNEADYISDHIHGKFDGKVEDDYLRF
jgi:hypothetical protein